MSKLNRIGLAIMLFGMWINLRTYTIEGLFVVSLIGAIMVGIGGTWIIMGDKDDR